MENGESLAFEALAEPTRREMLAILADGELSVTEIADRITQVGRTAVSSHLRILRVAGLVTERREGRFRLYSVNSVAATDVIDFLTTVYHSTLSDLRTATDSDTESHGSRKASGTG